MSEKKYTHSPTPWTDQTVIYLPSGHRNNGCDVPIRPMSEENWQLAKHCVNLHDELVDTLREAKLQIEYLQGKFQETGSGNSVLSRIETLLSKHTS